jgi:hypothetical protein
LLEDINGPPFIRWFWNKANAVEEATSKFVQSREKESYFCRKSAFVFASIGVVLLREYLSYRSRMSDIQTPNRVKDSFVKSQQLFASS